MFESLTERLGDAFRRLRGKGRLSAADVDEVLREVRLALLEADVHFKVVKDFLARVRERLVGEEVLQSLTAGETVITAVYEELVALLGGEAEKLAVSPSPPTVLMLVGLQGAGKTTTAAKLARNLQEQGRKVLLVAADTQRPAAVRQLEILGEGLNVPVFSLGGASPVEIARGGVAKGRSLARDVVIIDTAGRLHVDEELMDELRSIKATAHPQETLLVVDAMTGQEAVTVAGRFQSEVGPLSLILTKMDGDARGGAALSIRAVTGCPIKFVGTGEQTGALEPFYPDRLASRILGRGDIQTLLEKAQSVVTLDDARDLEQKLRKNELTLEDFLVQLRQVRRMGPLQQILDLLPGMGDMKRQMKETGYEIDEREVNRREAIISSMTRKERLDPSILNASRKRRIARGSGTTVQEVNQLLKQFEQMRKMMKMFGGSKRKGGFPGFPGMPFGPQRGR